MTVDELRDILDGVDGDVEVRLATQPAWPFEYDVQTALEFERDLSPQVQEDGSWAIVEETADGPEEVTEGLADEAAARREIDGLVAASRVFYLYEGAQLAYLPQAARTGWEQ